MSNNETAKEVDNESGKESRVDTQKQQNSFLQFWIKFYSQALSLTSSQNEDATATSNSCSEGGSKAEMDKHNKRVLIVMESIVKLTFGLDGEKKAQVVAHGGGALELIVELVRSTGVLLSSSSTSRTISKVKEEALWDETQRHNIILSTVKAIKSCVVRNPAGRWRCRSAGVLTFLCDVLDQSMITGNADIVEDIFTTLAAICLGNDLNALQGSSQMAKYLSQATKLYPDRSGMQQKILYLQTLFDAVRGEQSKILQWFRQQKEGDKKRISFNTESSFFQDVIQAELQIQSKNLHTSESNSTKQVETYSRSMDILQRYQHHTDMLDSLIIKLCVKRATELLLNGNAEECLKDTRFLLEKNADSADSKIDGLKLHSRALIQLGRLKEAEECLGKLKILCGHDLEVISLLEKLKV